MHKLQIIMIATAIVGGLLTACQTPAPMSEVDQMEFINTVDPIVANALVRPTRLEGMRPKSIRGRMKDKSFARQVSRENIMRCEQIGLPFSEFAQIAVKAMQSVADEIGLS